MDVLVVTMKDFMRCEPPSFFTRGGRSLWDAIKEDLKFQPMPTEWEEVKLLFTRSFERITGYPITHPEKIYCKELNGGGMSGGQVYPLFFNEVIVKFLEASFFGYKSDVFLVPYDEWIAKVETGML
jgi:hypothetical protein